MKSVRNNLLKYDIFFNDEKKASWKYIEAFYASDKSKPLRLAPKLTNIHIHPNNFQKMRVKYATQVFSESVAVGLSTYVCFNALPAEASETSEFLEQFDKLFDLFNSSKYKGAKKYNLAFMGADFQIQFLNKMVDLLNSIKIFDSSNKPITNKIKCFEGWVMTINSLKSLWVDCKNENHSFLFTRRLNQDCLENFFGTIRSQGGNCTNPTPQKFENAFKRIFSIDFLQHNESGNCVDDFDKILTIINRNVLQQVISNEEAVSSNTNDKLTFSFCDFRDLDFLAENALYYVSGYLYKKSLNVHACNVCEQVENKELTASNLFCHLKAYETKQKKTFGNLVMPNNEFVQFVKKMDDLFTLNFQTLSTQQNVGKALVNLFNQVDYTPKCPDFPKLYVCKLFCRMKIFHSLKHANSEFKNTDKQSKKLIKILHL
jgi:hypothetical protein